VDGTLEHLDPPPWQFNPKETFMDISIQVPRTTAQLDEVRGLMRSFISWHRQRHGEDLHLVDQYFDSAAFEKELASLPGTYAAPRGQLLLATFDGAIAGSVALREIDGAACEMKRMFIYPQFQGKGVGRALAEALIEEARRFGYASMRLDTSIRQNEAQGLYRRLGFQIIQPYYELPAELRRWLIFMELKINLEHI
jgi:ribosomal protein S18 acetylase RimI-like enzyme